MGYNALPANTHGYWNTAVGVQALLSNNTGQYNTAVGMQALNQITTGSQNTAIGVAAALYATGNNITALGYNAGYSNTGNNNTFVGTSAGANTGAINNYTAIGYNTGSGGAASNYLELGNSSVTEIRAQVTSITGYSDARIKDNVRENVPGLEFIKRLRPVTYNLNIHKQYALTHDGQPDKDMWDGKYDIEKITQSGFIAQEVESAASAVGYDFNGLHKPNGPHDLYGLGYTDFVVPLVKAVQEQQKMIEQQQSFISKQQEQMNQMQKEIEELKKK